MKLGTIEVNGSTVTVFEPPHHEPDFPWVDVEELAGAFLPRAEARRITKLTHGFSVHEGSRTHTVVRNGDRVATIICHAMAQGLCGMIDHKLGHEADDFGGGPAFETYCLAFGRFAADHWHLSFEEMSHAYHNPGGKFMRGTGAEGDP